MLKLTVDFIKSEFAKEGYQPLIVEYRNNKQHLDYICPNGHKHSIKWASWQQGTRCPQCYGNIKYDINFIKSEFEKEGYQLLTVEYKNNKQYLDYICPNGHHHFIKWNNWKNGYRCPHCAKNAKLSIDFIKSEFEKEQYILLSTKYENSKYHLNYICSNGHEGSTTWNNWQRGHRCKVCSTKKVNNKLKHSLDFIKSEFEKEGHRLLTTEYKDNKQKLDYICSNGHHHSVKWNAWQQNHRCPVCALINRSGSGHYNWKGGISAEPYCPVWSDKEYKADIKLRDGNGCLNPYCFGTGSKLHIHHIDYDKKNCGPQNLITLCDSCNFRANSDRKWHTAWYRTILNKRYGYNY